MAKRRWRFATRGGLRRSAGRIPSLGPRRRKLHIACDDFFMPCIKKSSRAHSAAPPFKTGPAALGSGFGFCGAAFLRTALIEPAGRGSAGRRGRRKQSCNFRSRAGLQAEPLRRSRQTALRQGGSQSRDPASAAAEVESLHSVQSLDASSGVSRFCFRGGVWFFVIWYFVTTV